MAISSLCASTSEISVEISAAVWETLGIILASRSIPKIRVSFSGNSERKLQCILQLTITVLTY